MQGVFGKVAGMEKGKVGLIGVEYCPYGGEVGDVEEDAARRDVVALFHPFGDDCACCVCGDVHKRGSGAGAFDVFNLTVGQLPEAELFAGCRKERGL
ncbi:hypothetical protein Barb7_02087 [Bacteroidales bacterium Barb7]|nr:hypothetical protein Barb7_02087 [Bacteroidales bacterium Barb7]